MQQWRPPCPGHLTVPHRCLTLTKILPCGVLCRVVWYKSNDVSDVPTASITRAMIHCPDDGGSKHLWHFGKLLPDYTAQHPTRHHHTRCSKNLNLIELHFCFISYFVFWSKIWNKFPADFSSRQTGSYFWVMYRPPFGAMTETQNGSHSDNLRAVCAELEPLRHNRSDYAKLITRPLSRVGCQVRVQIFPRHGSF
jgi:hypothetical protein